jgi:Fur family ferric uptake transcriptional regulator
MKAPIKILFIDAAKEKLRAKGMRITKPRVRMLTILQEEHGPHSAEEIFQRIKRAGDCDLVTVYRTLNTLEETGVVRRCDFGDGVRRYEKNDTHHHHHIVCRECGKIEELEDCIAEAIEKKLKKRGYSKISHSFEVFVQCASCTPA